MSYTRNRNRYLFEEHLSAFVDILLNGKLWVSRIILHTLVVYTIRSILQITICNGVAKKKEFLHKSQSSCITIIPI